MTHIKVFLLSLLSAGVCLTACKDSEPIDEPSPTPVVPGTVDTAEWPFDACIDTTVAPGDDFYAYISTGYTNQYKYGVMIEQTVLGNDFVLGNLANPVSETLQKLKVWEELSADSIHTLEVKAMRRYEAEVDTMSVPTMIRALIRNAVGQRGSFMTVNPYMYTRQPLLQVILQDYPQLSDSNCQLCAAFRDTTLEYIQSLQADLDAVFGAKASAPRKRNPDQEKFIRTLQDPTYHPTDLNYDNIDMTRMSETRASSEVSQGMLFLLDALGLSTDEMSWIPSASSDVCELITSLLGFKDEPAVQKALAAYLKLARINWSYTYTSNRGTPVTFSMKNLGGIRFFNMLFADDYCEQKITSADVDACKDLANQFRSTFRLRLDSLDWMSPSTKEYAKKKLDNMYFWYGLPARPLRDFDVKAEDADFAQGPSECIIRLSDRFYDTVQLPMLRSSNQDDQYYFTQSINNKQAPYAANAFYWPINNMMIILASNLIAPISQNDVSLPYNYAVIGATTIGHEMCHGFDSTGSKYDEVGNLKNWWAVSDALKYKEKQTQMTNIFNQYIFTNSRGSQFQVDGTATLGENMADFGGITIGLDALCRLRKSQGYDEAGIREQMRRYFLAWGIAWSEQTPYATDVKDTHSPNCIRVNGILNLMDDWYDIFGVKWGDHYYLEPDQRVRLW